MPRIQPLEASDATGKTKELLDEVQGAFGATPNLFRTAAVSEIALEAMWRQFQAIGSSSLGAGLVEQIAIAVSEVNGCSYCLSAHTYIGGLHNVSADELASSRDGVSGDTKNGAALQFAQSVTRQRGAISDAELGSVREAGWTDAEIVEILAVVALTTSTNWLAITTRIEVDFPVVPLRERLAA